MNNFALITGASGGIGRDFARIHAAEGGDLVIVARREESLQNLKQELESKHDVSVLCISVDLTEADAPRRVFDQLKSEDIEIDVLINNAGFGGHGKFHEREWEKDEAMIQLNITALCHLTRLFLPGMVQRNRGKILHVASMAAFLPGPLQAVYYATKAFVVSFSQALAEELSDTKVTSTALCPGAVDTGFASTANVEDVEGFKNMATSMDVAKVGYDAMLAGKLVVTNDWKYTFLKNWMMPFLPARTLLRISRHSMEKG